MDSGAKELKDELRRAWGNQKYQIFLLEQYCNDHQLDANGRVRICVDMARKLQDALPNSVIDTVTATQSETSLPHNVQFGGSFAQMQAPPVVPQGNSAARGGWSAAPPNHPASKYSSPVYQEVRSQMVPYNQGARIRNLNAAGFDEKIDSAQLYALAHEQKQSEEAMKAAGRGRGSRGGGARGGARGGAPPPKTTHPTKGKMRSFSIHVCEFSDNYQLFTISSDPYSILTDVESSGSLAQAVKQALQRHGEMKDMEKGSEDDDKNYAAPAWEHTCLARFSKLNSAKPGSPVRVWVNAPSQSEATIDEVLQALPTGQVARASCNEPL